METNKQLKEYVVKKWQYYTGETVEEAVERIKAKRKRRGKALSRKKKQYIIKPMDEEEIKMLSVIIFWVAIIIFVLYNIFQ